MTELEGKDFKTIIMQIRDSNRSELPCFYKQVKRNIGGKTSFQIISR
jgi:hypothetical protein